MFRGSGFRVTTSASMSFKVQRLILSRVSGVGCMRFRGSGFRVTTSASISFKVQRLILSRVSGVGCMRESLGCIEYYKVSGEAKPYTMVAACVHFVFGPLQN